MGLNLTTLHVIDTSIQEVFGQTRPLRMLELGDQVIQERTLAETTGKGYFERRGFIHVSVDRNGRHGAMCRDLTKPEQFADWHEMYEIITNSGTTEHVEPFEAQYDCFGIVHDCLKVGGIAIHLIPDAEAHDQRGAWKNHCHYYYTASFFEMLAQACGYRLRLNTVLNGLRCAVVQKTGATPFMNNRDLFFTHIARRKIGFSPRNIWGNALNRLGLR